MKSVIRNIEPYLTSHVGHGVVPYLEMRWDEYGYDPEATDVFSLLSQQPKPPLGDSLVTWMQAWPQYADDIEQFCIIWHTVIVQYNRLHSGRLRDQFIKWESVY